ncbi:AAA family ATPase [Halorussus ruber]|uniref:AAA family ATPase n=1 Tax=Halorussus ruber TaxID=1126238 RepID=UPI00109233DD|nr:MoxR family ATPase [Halorussus ruber]
MTKPAAIHEDLREEVGKVLVGNESVVEVLTISLLTRGHLLMEGVPGVAKTTIARLVGEATGLDVNRIQMTPDILPADITGTHIYREGLGEFELQRGPVFANVVVADEINRATPKTQSALLEAMQEGTVTIEGQTLQLPEPFIVVATQNPIEMEGTYELPVAQRDRFQFKVTVGLPDEDEEMTLLDRFDAEPDLGLDDISQVVTAEDILAAQEVVDDVHVEEAIKGYLRELVNATRESVDVKYGASPRATLLFLNAAKARAAIHGRDYVIPDDVKALARPVLTHRLVPSAEADLSDVTPEDVVEEVLATVEPPDGTAPVSAEEPAPTSE